MGPRGNNKDTLHLELDHLGHLLHPLLLSMGTLTNML